MESNFKILLLLLVYECTFVRNEEEKLTIELNNGNKMFGTVLYTILEKKRYYAFYKLPYAEPPLGDLRFKPPRDAPLSPRSSTDHTTPWRSTCPNPCNPHASEDCLYLNLFTPVPPAARARLPLMVWLRDTEHADGPDFLIEDDVIVIAVNYRRGPFGFLNLGNEVALGNMGAKDVVTALRWIRDNAGPFGGDVDNVTVFGSGDGATVASLLPLSLAANGLFSRVIVQGCSSLKSDMFRRQPRKAAERLRQRLERSCECQSDGWDLLSNSSSSEIVANSMNIYDSTEVCNDQRLVNAFGPSVEVESEGAFLSMSPVDTYRSNLVPHKVPMIIGYTNLESLYKVRGFMDNLDLLSCLNYNFQYILPFEGKAHTFCSSRYNTIGRRILDFFFANGTITRRSLRRYVNYLSDQTVYPVHRLARQHAAIGAPVYLYRMSFDGECNLARRGAIGGRKEPRGATAGDEICYLFRCRSADERYTSAEATAERSFIKKICRLWTNFAKYGDPTPTDDCKVLGSIRWTPLRPDAEPQLLKLGRRFLMRPAPELKRVQFWDRLKRDFYDESRARIEL